MIIKLENRPRLIADKSVDRWFVVGSSNLSGFWPTFEGAKECLEEEGKSAVRSDNQ